MTRRVAVVGGGIAGLAAAHLLATEAGADVVLFEGTDRLGGKIRTTPFAGMPVDEGADAFLARVPFAVELARAVGLGDQLTSPATGRAFVARGDALHPLPDGLVLGVPSELRPLLGSRLVSPLGVARAALDLVLPGTPLEGDVAVGALVRRRLGRQVAERLVDPMLGGINAGSTDELSLQVAAPQLAAVAGRSRSLLRGLRAQRRAAPAAPGAPVFHAPLGGMQRLVDAVADVLAEKGVDVRLDAPVTALERRADGWSVDGVDVDAVVVALPAPPAAALLRPLAPAAADNLAGIEYSSVVLVTLAYRRSDVRRALDGSGFLVPRVEGRLLTACSWASSKWAHLGADPELVVLRASVGRRGDERGLRMDDDALAAAVHRELEELLDLRGAPVERRISRWPAAFPQYLPGHLDRVDRLEAELARTAPGLALAGAALRGVGIPTCIASGQRAARLALG